MDKLELLRQKEEELRKINEELDMKNDRILTGAMTQLKKEQQPEEEEKDEVEDSMAGIKGQLLKPPSDEEEDDFENYENDGFEESKAQSTQGVNRSQEMLGEV